MKKLILLLLFLLPTVALGQTVIGNITILGATCAVTNACVVLPLGTAASSSSVTLTGTWTATVQFEASPDGGTTWVAINGTPPSSTTAVTSATANGAWTFNVGSMTHLRARASALASGTVGVNINASAAPILASAGSSFNPASPGAIGGTTPAAGTFTTLTAATHATTTNCAAAGSAANPSLVACTAASAGAFSCSTTASTGTCVVSSTSVTANSRIFIQPSAAEGANLSVTCNTTADTGLTAPRLASKSAGTSFTVNLGTFATNPLCFSYFIIN